MSFPISADRMRCIPAWLALTAILVGCNTGKQLDSRFTTGRQALQRGSYEAAIESLNAYLKAKPNGRLASRASFLIAKAHVGTGDYDAAREQFETTISRYADSEEAHKSRYKLAMLSLIEGDRDDARRRFRQLVEQPGGTLVPESEAMLRFLDENQAGVD